MKEKARRDNWDKMEKKKFKRDNMKRDWKREREIEAKLNHESMKKEKQGKAILNCSKNEKSENERFNLQGKKKKFGKGKMNGDYEKKDELKCISKKKKLLDEGSSSLELEQKEKMRKKGKTKKRKLRFDLEETKEKLSLSFEDKESSENYSRIPQGSAFFKIMLESFKEFMFIPPSFAEEIGILVNQPIYLKHCNDQYWTVFLNLKDGCLAFRQGWHDFIVNHSITERELLVFTYEGDSDFTVRIFGVDCKERKCVQKNKKGMDGKRKESETQFEDFLCDKKQRNYETAYGEMGHNIFYSPKKKVPNVAEKATKAFKHEIKCNSSSKKVSNKTEKSSVKIVQNSVKKIGRPDTTLHDSLCKGNLNSVKEGTKVDTRNDANYKKKEQKVMKKPKKDKACSPNLFNGSKKVKIIKKDKKKIPEKNADKHTDPNDGLFNRKDKKLNEGRRSSGKSKPNSGKNIDGCQGTDFFDGHKNINGYRGSDFFAAPICPLPINAFMSIDEYSCTSCTEKTTNLNNLCCDFLVDEYGVCHNTDEHQMNKVNESMFHSGHEMKHNASKKDQIRLINCSTREAIADQNFRDNLKDKNYVTGKEEKDMAYVSTKKPSVDAKHKNTDVKYNFSLVPATFRFDLTIPSWNDWITLPEKLPVPDNRYGRRVIMLRNSLCKIWPVLYIEDCFFVGFSGGWKSFVEANCFHEGDLVEFMEFPGSQYTLQIV